MRQIFEQIGDTALTGLIAALLIAIVAGMGLLSVVGSRLSEDMAAMDTYEDATRMKEICEREKPKICYEKKGIWKAGQKLPISDLFYGRDADGKSTAIKILDITNSLGENSLEAYTESENTVTFLQAGIYTFKLQTNDEHKKYTTCEISIAVDNRKE